MKRCIDFIRKIPVLSVLALVFGLKALAADEIKKIPALYLKLEQERPVVLSNLDPIPEDLGLKGAQLAVKDNNTTGSFMNYRFDLEIKEIAPQDAPHALAQNKAYYVLIDASAQDIKTLSAQHPERLFFNVSAYEDDLRAENCAANLLHSLPSYQMRSDALMQLVLKKRWTDMVLIEGRAPKDALFAAALRKSARKFQLEFSKDEKWIFEGDMRRQASAEVPLFTQKLGAYDVMFVADEQNDFARYLAYNTWTPSLLMGADGLRATAWDRVNEQWGAAQLQSRFADLAGRDMQDEDYAAWAALRAIDEANIRTQFADHARIRDYLLNDLELAGFKGRPLSFRHWNGQLRQPIGLTHASAVVAMAPLEGFLHARNELDSLGQDAPESKCQAFGDPK